MLKIVKSNSETSNNSAKLAAVTLIISIAKLVATALVVPIAATLPKLTTLAILVIATPLKRDACKAAGSHAASNAS
jgi:hypothetical protein